MKIGTIAGVQNDKIKLVRSLQKRGDRDDTGFTLVEGILELSRVYETAVLPSPRIHIHQLFVCRERISGPDAQTVVDRCQSIAKEVYEVSIAVYEKIAYREESGGAVAVVPIPDLSLATLSLGRDPLVLVVEAVEKPGNLGAMIRSADGAGADAVVVCDPATDAFNPNVIRASLGTVFSLPVACASSDDTYRWLKEKALTVVAAQPGGSVHYCDVNYQRGTALAIGSEHRGLSVVWLERADVRVHIPMNGRADSLNAAMAATILLFEAARQRRHGLSPATV